MRRSRLAGSVVAVTVLLAGSSCAHRSMLPLPRPYGETIALKVAYVVNPSFPSMKTEQIRAVLSAARGGVKENFGVDVQFLEPEEQSLKSLFDRVTSKDRSRWYDMIYDFKSGKGDRTRLTKGYAAAFRGEDNSLEEMITYAQPYLLFPLRERTYQGLAEAVTATLVTRLEQIKSQKLPDGTDLIDGSPNNEVIFWAFIGRLSFPYDVVITNQLIASAEYVGSSVHTAIRGGITNGITTSNPSSRYETTAIVSTYPLIGEDHVTRTLRGDETYSEAESARFAGLLLVHEIGHQLFHFNHPYGRRSCVMNPPEMLHFRGWAESLSPKDCPLGESAATKPGFDKVSLAEK
jgi:hypothetical protein